MLAQIDTVGLRGVESFRVRVEVNLSSGLPSFAVVGLPAGAVREGRERVMAALRNSGVPVPPKRVTVNLAPADVPKSGSSYDLPIAVGLMVGAGVIPPSAVADTAFVGEVGLDGALRPVPGVLPMAAGVRRMGRSRIVVPRENGPEAALVDGLEVVAPESLGQLRDQLLGRLPPTLAHPPDSVGDDSHGEPVQDLRDVRGQEVAKRAIEIAAAGGHNLLLVGPPGCGKTMLARRIQGVLPGLGLAESLEVTAVHSVAGRTVSEGGVLARPPFRAPHHSSTHSGLIGGGAPPKPGEVSLAHRGVLFLDELAEFRRPVLEALRQPLEEGYVILSRARHTVRYPARFILVAAMNPCPCGHRGDGTERCTCDHVTVARYRSRVSGPLLDRFDLHLMLSAVKPVDLVGPRPGETTARVRDRVQRAREIQGRRLADVDGTYTNGRMGLREMRRHCRISPEVADDLRRLLARLELSARAYHRILRVSRTLADLDGAAEVGRDHVAEAVQYRAMDRRRHA